MVRRLGTPRSWRACHFPLSIYFSRSVLQFTPSDFNKPSSSTNTIPPLPPSSPPLHPLHHFFPPYSFERRGRTLCAVDTSVVMGLSTATCTTCAHPHKRNARPAHIIYGRWCPPHTHTTRAAVVWHTHTHTRTHTHTHRMHAHTDTHTG